MANADETAGHLLAGRVRYSQPAVGFRSGNEPVLLAASVPAGRGDRVLEGGSGAGAMLLCLAARVPGVQGLGIEQDQALLALAERNAAANGWPDLRFLAGDITAQREWGPFDHACANPPYHGASGTPSPDPARRAAKRGAAGLLGAWAAALARPLRRRGTLSFILPAALLAEAMTAFSAAGCNPTGALPLWPKPGRAARLLILRGVKASRAPFRLLPGLVLHRPDGSFTPEAEAILRGGGALEV